MSNQVMSTDHTCEAHIHTAIWTQRLFTCSKPAKYTELVSSGCDDLAKVEKHFCGTHAPSRIKAREAAADVKFAAKNEQRIRAALAERSI